MKLHRNRTHRQDALAERGLFAAAATLRSASEVRAFLRDLCTPAEIQAMADRWAVVEWLQRGLPYREIHRVTGVSVTTIARVARCLASGSGGYALARQRLGAVPDGDAQDGEHDTRAPERADGTLHAEADTTTDGVRHA